jgi:hypothetical protein
MKANLRRPTKSMLMSGLMNSILPLFYPRSISTSGIYPYVSQIRPIDGGDEERGAKRQAHSKNKFF